MHCSPRDFLAAATTIAGGGWLLVLLG